MEWNPASKKWMWAGTICSGLPVAMLLISGIMKIIRPEPVVEGFTKMGWHPDQALGLGILELASTALYIYPRTANLGAILLTGYLGGAIATHVRLGEPFFIQFFLGVLLWLGLWFRDPRVRAILPLTE